jgi:hypothetical protein
MASSGLIPVVQRSYDLCAGLYGHVNRFPRAQRTLLGRMILDEGLRLLVLLTLANRRATRGESLEEASGRLDSLRISLRLAHRLGFLSNGGYAELSEVADEVGRMLGGWLKHQKAVEPGHTPREPSGAPAASSGAAPAAKPRASGVRYRMTSPTIERYLRAKLARPEAIVFLGVGAFLQTFFEDAVFCGRELRLAVRNLAADSEPEKIPACDFPRTKLEKYTALLRQHGRELHVG